jgi:PBP4 family serine-type D-alanyl-D-alanine carboxypeptidase
MNEKLLIALVSQLRLKKTKTLNNLVIDDSIVDAKSWGTGWMWDDNTNPYMPQVSAFNLNHNLINLKITPQKDKNPLIEVFPSYPVQIISRLKNSDITDIKIDRQIFMNPDVIISGELSAPVNKLIPILNPADFFVYRLKELFNMSSISFNPIIKTGEVPFVAEKVAFVKHNLKEIINSMNKQSDNLAAEVVLKHVGAKYSHKSGTTEDGLKFFQQHYKNLGADTSDLSLVDGSGASHNDLLTTNWMTLALSKISNSKYFDIYQNSLAVPSQEGTLKNRLTEFRGKLHAKTGTNAGISGITGYLTTKSGQKICFAILIQNFKGDSCEAKNLEDKIIGVIGNF